MIKDIFEIESKQKNALLSIIGITFICFLQLYLFKENILKKSSLEIIGVCLSLTVCWLLLNIVPLVLFMIFTTNYPNEIKGFQYEKLIAVLGIIALFWVSFLTYISYELKLCFKELIRIGIISTIFRILFWSGMLFFTNQKDKKLKKQALKIPVKTQNLK
jgi:hypothetical protein